MRWRRRSRSCCSPRRCRRRALPTTTSSASDGRGLVSRARVPEHLGPWRHHRVQGAISARDLGDEPAVAMCEKNSECNLCDIGSEGEGDVGRHREAQGAREGAHGGVGRGRGRRRPTSSEAPSHATPTATEEALARRVHRRPAARAHPTMGKYQGGSRAKLALGASHRTKKSGSCVRSTSLEQRETSRWACWSYSSSGLRRPRNPAERVLRRLLRSSSRQERARLGSKHRF